MSCSSSATNDSRDWRAQRCGNPWRPLEIVAMILGFVLFWPVGLAILAFKIWQSKTGHRGDLTAFVQQKADWARDASRGWQPGQWATRATSWSMQAGGPAARTGGGWNMRSSGNAAFDDWRGQELARLEAERRKLEEAEREFTEHIDELRRARDAEEFERFMKARRDRAAGPPPAAS